MIVHLAASLRDPKVDAEYLRRVIEVVHDQGGVLSHNWLEPALMRAEENIYVPDWKPYVKANLEGVKRADIVIIDLTHYSFSQGFLVAAALEYKKPILALSRLPLEGTTVDNITNALFVLKQYSTEEELTTHVRTFIEQNTIHTKDLRFNMFLTRNIYKYLEEISQETGRNKSEIIRQTIKRKVQESKRND